VLIAHTHTHKPKKTTTKNQNQNKKNILEQKLCGLDAKISPPTNPVLLNLSTVRRKARLNISINCELALKSWNGTKWNGMESAIQSSPGFLPTMKKALDY